MLAVIVAASGFASQPRAVQRAGAYPDPSSIKTCADVASHRLCPGLFVPCERSCAGSGIDDEEGLTRLMATVLESVHNESARLAAMINASTAAVEAAALQRAWQDLTNSALEPEQEPVSSRSQRSATGSYLDLLYPNMQPSGPDLYCFPVGTTWRTAASTCLQLAGCVGFTFDANKITDPEAASTEGGCYKSANNHVCAISRGATIYAGCGLVYQSAADRDAQCGYSSGDYLFIPADNGQPPASGSCGLGRGGDVYTALNFAYQSSVNRANQCPGCSGQQTLKFVPSSTLLLGKHGYWTKKQAPGGVIDENIDWMSTNSHRILLGLTNTASKTYTMLSIAAGGISTLKTAVRVGNHVLRGCPACNRGLSSVVGGAVGSGMTGSVATSIAIQTVQGVIANLECGNVGTLSGDWDTVMERASECIVQTEKPQLDAMAEELCKTGELSIACDNSNPLNGGIGMIVDLVDPSSAHFNPNMAASVGMGPTMNAAGSIAGAYVLQAATEVTKAIYPQHGGLCF
uniref:Uncharacterized protein n=1 Tax=Emiliania huxleyi TaxID=2903 RepID=A0A7S3U2G0_EMIHU|mmetsp:Transcript_28212/g.84200  ORF Transcript_28212/g.84200 Transcript_28212/m.84200 type:complete len:517 (+) Transcript_28212:38-1588(+)